MKLTSLISVTCADACGSSFSSLRAAYKPPNPPPRMRTLQAIRRAYSSALRLPRTGWLLSEQADLRRAAGGLGAGPAAQLGQDVSHMHVNGPHAEDEPLGDLAVGQATRGESHDLELAAREAGVLVVGGR